MNAILYVAENGCKWRALPRRYGHWNTVYRRFRRRTENDVLSQASQAVQKKELIDSDFSVLSLDSTFVKSSPSAAGALKNGSQALRRTKGVKQLATMVRAIVAGPTIPAALKLTPGNVGDEPVGRELLRSLDVKRFKPKFVLMDRANAGDETRRTARNVGLKPVVPSKRNRQILGVMTKDFANVETKSSVSFVALLKTSAESRRVTTNSTQCFGFFKLCNNRYFTQPLMATRPKSISLNRFNAFLANAVETALLISDAPTSRSTSTTIYMKRKVRLTGNKIVNLLPKRRRYL